MKVLRQKFKTNEFGENEKSSEERVVEELGIETPFELLQFERLMAAENGKSVRAVYTYGELTKVVIIDRKGRTCEYVSIISK